MSLGLCAAEKSTLSLLGLPASAIQILLLDQPRLSWILRNVVPELLERCLVAHQMIEVLILAKATTTPQFLVDLHRGPFLSRFYLFQHCFPDHAAH